MKLYKLRELKDGDTDIWFAWYPVLTDTGEIVWLEKVSRTYVRNSFNIGYYYTLLDAK